ncbi:thioesterase family protein [Hymenobacter taeanensis]|uniref:Thioesterase family protein n=1 Tax=Hymenobacter taeanensis TaxID=2735321 RepID=A0A6M6BJK3_9BACT|nr:MULTISPECIES: thioesterase family protein [Hymenobacter]QJX48266.1 thioesterase family protein [Hymenobacter taeanensis]UOQ82252.1 thioesterase family protein [Hymenobacter sp. 5414T-23]
MTTPYEKTYTVRWADMDPNGHMRHSAYTDYAAQLRIEYLAAQGFSLQRFAQLGIGPILFREDTRFLKEMHISEPLRVNGELAGLNEDGSRWRIVHTLFKADGRPAATVTVDGAWLDLRARKLMVPPAEITDIMRNLPRHESYADIVREPKV